MNGWMFFPAEKSGDRNREFDIIFEAFPGTGHLSREEWHEFVPESRERLQGRTLGFCCGGASVAGMKKSPAEFPPFPIRILRSDLMIMPLCWTYRTVLNSAAIPDREYRWIRPNASRAVLTVTGAFADKPPCFRVCGSYSFFPPRYRVAKV